MGSNRIGFYEFFAGGGMARLGLGERWRCLMANELSAKKAETYIANHGLGPELRVDDVANLTTSDLPHGASLAWASFPCQDLSLAGWGRGLKGERSGTFWPFWRLMEGLAEEGRPCPVIVLENVVGALSSRQGQDFQAICRAIARQGYRFGPMVVNAVHFLPQSRPRLYVVAVHAEAALPAGLVNDGPNPLWHPRQIIAAHERLSPSLRGHWVWWAMPHPPAVEYDLWEIIEAKATGQRWHSAKETAKLLEMMSPVNKAKLAKAQSAGRPVVGTVYRRTRRDEFNRRLQRAEVRFDQISGCLRTPAGGSSRQIIVVVDGKRVRSRLLSSREAARLMGLPETYRLPARYNDAYNLVGDGLAVPVVSWLEEHLLYSFASQHLLTQAA